MKFLRIIQSFFGPKTPAQQFAAGDILASGNALKGYQLIKVLEVEEEFDGIHLYLFRGNYSYLPKADEVEELLAKRNENRNVNSLEDALAEMSNSASMEIMHMPLSLSGFLKEKPVFLKNLPLLEEELEGYHYYLEEMGIDTNNL